VGELRARLAGIRERVETLPRVRVACLEWIDPVFALGNWGPELVDHAGGECLVGRPGELSRAIEWEDVCASDPEVLVVAPCGFGIDRTLAEMHVLTRRRGWDDLRAVRQGRVFVADGNLYFNRSSPSMFETVEILAEILHPREFRPGHAGRGWRRYPFSGPDSSSLAHSGA